MRGLPLLLPPLLLAVAACAAPQPRGGRSELAEATAGRTAGLPVSCVPTDNQRALRILDDRTLALESGRTLWVSRLAEACPGLEPSSRLIVEVEAGRYCRNDRFRTLSPGTSIPGPVCVLGDFTPYARRGG